MPPSSALGLSRSRIYSNCTKRSAVSCRGVGPLALARQPASQVVAHRQRHPLPQPRVPRQLTECPGATAAGWLWLREAGPPMGKISERRVTRYQPTPQEKAQRKRVSGFVLANPEKSKKRLPSASRSSRGCASSKPSHLGPVGVVESCKKYAAQNGSSPKPCRRAKRSIRALRQILCEWELPSSTIRKAR